jgi:tetratricopeptide (TPR) repeat protein
MSEHGGPAGADGFDGGRGHETHGIPRPTDARTTTTVTNATDVGWRQRHQVGVLRSAGGGMVRMALAMAPPAPRGTPALRPLEPPAVQGEHLGKDVLWRFMTGGLSAAEMRNVFGHLLRGCASCREQAREVWNITDDPAATSARRAIVDAAAAAAPPAGEIEASFHAYSKTTRESHPVPQLPETPATPATAATSATPATPAIAFVGPLDTSSAEAAEPSEPAPAAGPGGPNEAAYETVLDRVFSRIATEEAGIEVARRRAAVLFEELMQHPPARQQLLVQNSARFRDRMLCERLLAASHDEGFHEPARSEQLARIAVAVAERVADACPEAALESSGPAPSDALAGLRARAWAQLGNALRIGSNLEGAAAAFRSADALMAAHPRLGLLDKARIFDLKASLCKDRRHFVEAARLLDRVITIYQRLGQSNLKGRALSQKALLQFYAGDREGCMALLHRALELIDPHEDPRCYLNARHNLIMALADDGKPREAFALLFHTRPLYLKMGDRMSLLRLRWLEGQVARGLHRLEQAETAFREVRGAYVEMGLDYDVALVSLDLATVFAQQGRAAEMRRLAEEMLVFFESRQILPEAMAAFLVFCNAARIEQAGLALVQEVAAFLQRARHAPGLRFVPAR